MPLISNTLAMIRDVIVMGTPMAKKGINIKIQAELLAVSAATTLSLVSPFCVLKLTADATSAQGPGIQPAISPTTVCLAYMIESLIECLGLGSLR